MNFYLSETPCEIVRDSNVVRVSLEVLQRDVHGEERRGQKKAQQQCMRHYQSRISHGATSSTSMQSWLFLLLLFLPFCNSAPQDPRQKQLVDLAAAGNGVIQLDDAKYDLLNAAKRNWSFAVHFTALDPRRKCNQCRSVELIALSWYISTCYSKQGSSIPHGMRLAVPGQLLRRNIETATSLPL